MNRRQFRGMCSNWLNRWQYGFDAMAYTQPSVLWRCCWLVGRKGIQPVKNWVVGCWRGYLSGVRCRLADSPISEWPLPLTVSCFSKIQIGSTFLVPAYLGSPGKRAIKWVCVCIYSTWLNRSSTRGGVCYLRLPGLYCSANRLLSSIWSIACTELHIRTGVSTSAFTPGLLYNSPAVYVFTVTAYINRYFWAYPFFPLVFFPLFNYWFHAVD